MTESTDPNAASAGEGGASSQTNPPVSSATDPATGKPTGSSQPGGTNQTSASDPSTEGSHAQTDPDNGKEADPSSGILSQALEVDGKEAQKEQDSKVFGAPEGGYKFTASPDGKQTFDEGTLGAFGEVAKELNLSQESAQKIVDKMGPALLKRTESLRAEWATASLKDEEFGGANFQQNLKGITRAYKATTTQGFRDVLRNSGLDSHPEVLRHFYRLSRAMGDGRIVNGNGGQNGGDKGLQVFYEGMNP